jgi:nucleotide-binding universal stress UspA family protein
MLELKSILLMMRAGSDCAAGLDLTARLAREHGAMVTGLCGFTEPELELSDCYAIGPDAAVEVMGHRESKVREATAPAEAAFQGALSGVELRWGLLEPDEPPEITALKARCFDLAILPTPRVHASGEVGLEETVLETAATPCLLAPRLKAPASFDRVLIAWNGSPEARRAVDAAMLFLKRASTVRILTAGDRPFADAPGLATWLTHHGVHAQVDEVPHPKGARADLILGRCASFEADLLVMGAFGHSRVAEDVFGGTTRTILRAGALPVLMAH